MYRRNSHRSGAAAGLLMLAVISLLPLWNNCQAADVTIIVQGLFRDKALLSINGKRRLMVAGETTPDGIKLVHANSREAILEIDGVLETYTLGAHIGGRIAPTRSKPEARVWANERGLFATVGTINGLPVNFLVDTGATTVAINADEARRLGIDYQSFGRKTGIQTASGTGTAYQVKLNSVGIGDITLNNVDAVVLEGTSPVTPLLGMSFLGSLEIVNRGDVMLLRQKY